MAPSQTNKKLRADRLKKLGVSPQALSQQRQRLQKKVAMPTDIATYVIAHRNGIRIDRYLDHETIERVNGADCRLPEVEGGSATAVTIPARPRTKPVKPSKTVVLGDVDLRRAGLSKRHMRDAERMANEAYPVLYVFENSIREFIDGHLTAAYDKNWFDDNQIVSRPVRETVERNRKAEGRNRYHSQRNARSIYYTNLDDLSKVVQSTKGSKVFKSLFPRPTWFPELVSRIEVSRNVVAHMNPLTKQDVRRLADALTEWQTQTRGREPPTSA
jgi:hypothetical protein